MNIYIHAAHNAFQSVKVGSKLVCEVDSRIADKSLRLVDSDVDHRGTLEVYHNNEWGAICSDNFFAAEGHVACRDLGYSGISEYAHVT